MGGDDSLQEQMITIITLAKVMSGMEDLKNRPEMYEPRLDYSDVRVFSTIIWC